MRPLRVMLDARMLIGRFSGVSRVVTKLVDASVRRDDIQVVVLCASQAASPWAGRRDVETITCDFDRKDRTPARRLWWEERRLPGIIRRAGVDVYHATWNTGVPALRRVPVVLSIHDLIPWHDPRSHFATCLQEWCYRLAMRASVRRATLVTAVSQHVRRQVLTLFRVDPRRVVTVPNGVAPVERIEVQRATAPYALYVGGHHPRKNVAAMFAAIQQYWDRFDDPLELWLTGCRTSLCQDATEMYRRLKHPWRIRFLGDIADDALARHYASATMLLMLSRDEGFGLPVLEAMAYGCPVIAAAAGSLPEVGGDAAILVAPDDARETADAIRRLRVGPSDTAELVRRGRNRAAAFSWDLTAERMTDLYLKAALESRAPRTTFSRVCSTAQVRS